MTNIKEPVNTTISTKYFRELKRLAEIGRQQEPEIKDGTLCFTRDRLTDDRILVLYEHEVMQHWEVKPLPVVTGDIPNVTVWIEHDGHISPVDGDINVLVEYKRGAGKGKAKGRTWPDVLRYTILPETGEQE